MSIRARLFTVALARKKKRLLANRNNRTLRRKKHQTKWQPIDIVNPYLVSFALWQITSTARLKAKPKATASHIEDLTTIALIIMIRLNRATITVKAFFSVKYFFIAVDLHEVRGRQI